MVNVLFPFKPVPRRAGDLVAVVAAARVLAHRARFAAALRRPQLTLVDVYDDFTSL